MFKSLTLRTKLMAAGCLLTALPLLAVALVNETLNSSMRRTAETASTNLAYADLDHIAQGVYALVSSHQEVNEKNVRNALNVARDVLSRAGGISFVEEKLTWTAENQFTKASITVDLPKMMVGPTWLGQVREQKVTVPVVDQVMDLVGVTCTVFQRINEAGDMLRVATNVMQKDGTRAIGTYIPAVGPDGRPNPVVSTVLKGQTFNGRAFVVDRWYITAYEPLRDGDKGIVGMLYVGIPQESAKSLRDAIMGIKVGKTGYVYILDSAGRYVVSMGGKRDGEDISNAKDSGGNLFIQEIVRKALALGPAQIAEHSYPWKNAGDPEARMKVARLMYFKPWDWIIGAGSYVDEFMEAPNKVKQLGDRSRILLWILLGFSLFAAAAVWLLISAKFAKPINHAIEGLNEAAEKVSAAASQVSSSSQSLAEGASEQAASIEETSSSLEEMSAMTKMNAENTHQADVLMNQAAEVITKANLSMSHLTESMQQISKASEETSKIIKTIDEIAFQTNLLALNAAVEAARAGEAGAGFAVVADEVRNLAIRAAEAARNTSGLIEGTVKRVKDGAELVVHTGEAFGEIAGSVGKLGKLVAEIASASHEQAQGIEQVNRAVTEMDKVVQQNAAHAEESASASEEMNAQAEEMKASVRGLVTLVKGGTHDASEAPSQKAGRGHKPPPGYPRASFRPKSEKKTVSRAEEMKPEEVIPFDEDSFKDF